MNIISFDKRPSIVTGMAIKWNLLVTLADFHLLLQEIKHCSVKELNSYRIVRILNCNTYETFAKKLVVFGRLPQYCAHYNYKETLYYVVMNLLHSTV
jgi:hypothetical protein